MTDKQKAIPSRPVLGKGLASLLPGAATRAPQQAIAPTVSGATSQTHETESLRHPGITLCNIDEIVPNEFQPRKVFDDETIEELAQSIRANGLIQPLVVRKAPKGGYELIAGERRLRASKKAGLKQVPIVVRRTTDREALELALIENIQREDLNCIDTALAYYQLINDFDLTQDGLAPRVGKDRTSIANHLRLLRLPQSVQNLLKERVLTFGHGKALAGLEDSRIIEKLAFEAKEQKWSVREIENQIQKLKAKSEIKDASGLAADRPEDLLELRLRNLSKELSTKLGTKTLVRGNEKRGKIVIEYFSAEDLDRMLTQLLS